MYEFHKNDHPSLLSSNHSLAVSLLAISGNDIYPNPPSTFSHANSSVLLDVTLELVISDHLMQAQ